jgi:hypothetical protein
MGGLNISVQWRSAVTQENGQAWCFPNKLTPYFKERYSIPAVYRWRIDKRQPGEKERIYIGEGEELTRRILWVLKPHSSSKASDTNRRLNEIFHQCALEKRAVWIDIADIDPFEINGVRFDQRDLGDRFKRRMLENLLLAIAGADKNCELLNNDVEPLDRDRELLIRRLSPRQVRETKQRYFGSSDT